MPISYLLYATVLWWAKLNQASRVILGDLYQTNDVCVSRRAEHTCVVEHSRPPAWCAAGVSYVSFHPDVNLLKPNELFFDDLIWSFAYAGKFLFAVKWFGKPMGKTDQLFVTTLALDQTLLVTFWPQHLKHSLKEKVIFRTDVSCIRVPFTAVNRVIGFSSEAPRTRRCLTCLPFWRKT